MFINTIFFLFINIFVFYINALDSSKILSLQDCTNIKFICAINSSSSDASVIKIIYKDDIFILKQINNPNLDEQFLLINDLVASNFGYQNGIQVNHVYLIPANLNINIKIYKTRAATIHKFIFGEQAEILKELSDQFILKLFSKTGNYCYLHQRVNSTWSNILKDEEGLTKEVITAMSLHEDLAKIVAFDTYIGNSDRSLPNIFYCKNTNKFWGIDHAASFCKKLPLLAIERLNELIKQNYFKSCSLSILKGLKIYRDTLVKLATDNNHNFLKINLKYYSQYILPDNLYHDQDLQDRIRFELKIIDSNYIDTKKLILLLDFILSVIL